jgi:hypothetical protein
MAGHQSCARRANLSLLYVGCRPRPREQPPRCLKLQRHAPGPTPRPVHLRPAAEASELGRPPAPAAAPRLLLLHRLPDVAGRRGARACPVRRRTRTAARPPPRAAEALPRRHHRPVDRTPAAAAREEGRRGRLPLIIAAAAAVLGDGHARQQARAAEPAAPAPSEGEQRLARGVVPGAGPARPAAWLSEPGRRRPARRGGGLRPRAGNRRQRRGGQAGPAAATAVSVLCR